MFVQAGCCLAVSSKLAAHWEFAICWPSWQLPSFRFSLERPSFSCQPERDRGGVARTRSPFGTFVHLHAVGLEDADEYWFLADASLMLLIDALSLVVLEDADECRLAHQLSPYQCSHSR
jgi:hypothetical protein